MSSHASGDPEDREYKPEAAIERSDSPVDDDGPQLSWDELIDIERRVRGGGPVSEAERAAYQAAKGKMRASMAAARFRTSDLISPTTMGMLRSINDQQNSMVAKLANIPNPLASVDWSGLTAVNFKVPTVSPAALLGIQNLYTDSSEFQRLSESITKSALRNVDLSFRRIGDLHPPDDEGMPTAEADSNVAEKHASEVEPAEPEAEVIWELDPAAYQQAGIDEMREAAEALKSLCATAIIGNGLMREQIAQNNQANLQLSTLHDSFIGVSSDLSAVKEDVRVSGEKTNRIAVATLITAILTLVVAAAALFGS